MHSRRAAFVAEHITRQLKSLKPRGSNPLNQWPTVTAQMVMNADRRWRERHTNLQKPATGTSPALSTALKALLSSDEPLPPTVSTIIGIAAAQDIDDKALPGQRTIVEVIRENTNLKPFIGTVVDQILTEMGDASTTDHSS